MRPIHAETPKPAKERKFLKQDLAIINEQFEALGKDWSKMKNQQPQRGQASKARCLAPCQESAVRRAGCCTPRCVELWLGRP